MTGSAISGFRAIRGLGDASLGLHRGSGIPKVPTRVAARWHRAVPNPQRCRTGAELTAVILDPGEHGDLGPHPWRHDSRGEQHCHQLALPQGWGLGSGGLLPPEGMGLCRSSQLSLQWPFGAFWSPAGSIDLSPLIPVMHRAGSGAAPSTNVPSGKGMGRGPGGGPRAACVQLPGEAHATHVRSLLKDTGVSSGSCWLGRCSRQASRCPELQSLSCHSPATASGCS